LLYFYLIVCIKTIHRTNNFNRYKFSVKTTINYYNQGDIMKNYRKILQAPQV